MTSIQAAATGRPVVPAGYPRRWLVAIIDRRGYGMIDG